MCPPRLVRSRGSPVVVNRCRSPRFGSTRQSDPSRKSPSHTRSRAVVTTPGYADTAYDAVTSFVAGSIRTRAPPVATAAGPSSRSRETSPATAATAAASPAPISDRGSPPGSARCGRARARAAPPRRVRRRSDGDRRGPWPSPARARRRPQAAAPGAARVARGGSAARGGRRRRRRPSRRRTAASRSGTRRAGSRARRRRRGRRRGRRRICSGAT